MRPPATEFLSSPLTDNIRAARSGYIFGATGTWAIWDWGATFGQVKQAKRDSGTIKNHFG